MSTTMTPSKETIGSMRYQSDMRQIGALLMVTGILAIVQPLASIAALIGPDGTTASSGIPFSALFAGVCLVSIGFLSVFTGYNQIVHDWGNKNITGALMILTQTAFIPYFTGMVEVGRAARTGMAFIPADYNPTESQVHFVGAMGILGIMSYGFTFVGSISFMQFSLYAYQAGKPESRPSKYYNGRMAFYTGMLFVAGLSQLLLGSFLASNFGEGGSLPFGPIAVKMYVVNFPAISILVGLVQICNAVWGFVRSRGLLIGGSNSSNISLFQVSMFAGWFLQVTLQIITQVSYSVGGTFAPAAPTVFCLSFGLNLMPAFLDFKMRNTPETILPEFYGLEGNASETGAQDDLEDTEKGNA
jgi:hypothetical protein